MFDTATPNLARRIRQLLASFPANRRTCTRHTKRSVGTSDGAKGIGFAIAKTFAAEGTEADVVAKVRSLESLGVGGAVDLGKGRASLGGLMAEKLGNFDTLVSNVSALVTL